MKKFNIHEWQAKQRNLNENIRVENHKIYHYNFKY